jgi:D-alanyl-D-alanine carboxypeptidase
MTCSHMPTLHTLTPRIQPARWHFVRSPLAYAFMVAFAVAMMCATALTAQAAPSSKAVRSEPPKHTAGDIGQLPPEVLAALQRAKVPSDNFHVMVIDTHSGSTPRLSHQAQERVNPASLMKLATTTAALDTLGPAFVWRTPVYMWTDPFATVCCTATSTSRAAATRAWWWSVCGC